MGSIKVGRVRWLELPDDVVQRAKIKHRYDSIYRQFLKTIQKDINELRI